MKKLRGYLILMVVVMLVITGFQVYWLTDNYDRERKGLEIRATSVFRETIRSMQDSALQAQLQAALKDTSRRIVTNRISPPRRSGSTRPPAPTARIIRMLGDKRRPDTLRLRDSSRPTSVFISVRNGSSVRYDSSAGGVGLPLDSIHPRDIKQMVFMNTRPSGATDTVIRNTTKWTERQTIELSRTVNRDTAGEKTGELNTIYLNDDKGDRFVLRIDSVFSDSLPLPLVQEAVGSSLRQEKMDVPFTVKFERHHDMDEGFRPLYISRIGGEDVPYRFELGNTFSYVISRISLPIVFSFFLVGLTLVAFLLLYRSLLRQHRLGVMKNDLISNISHELKTPIATVGVALEALKNFNAIDDAARTREYLDISQQEIQRLNLLVDKVLKLSVFERKEMELRKEWFDARELTNQIINSMKLQFEKYGASVELREEGDQFQLEADKLHISSVVYNLLDNALKYSREKPVITVTLRSRAEHLEISVTDNGIGIPSMYKARVFDKFFRVPQGDRHNAKGYGLGLSYVTEVLKQHQGFIEVQSELDKGSTFTAYIPYQEKDIINFGNDRIIKRK